MQLNPTSATGSRPDGPGADYTPDCPALATPRLRLRPLEAPDTVQMEAMAADPHCVDGTLDAPVTAGADYPWQWLTANGSPPDLPRAMRWAVSLLGDDRIIGYTALDEIDQVRGEAELSFWFEAAEDWTPLASEAAQAALAFAFTDLGLARVCAFSVADHLQPAEVLGEIGLVPIAAERPAPRAPAVNDLLSDVLMWETSRSQWINHLQD